MVQISDSLRLFSCMQLCSLLGPIVSRQSLIRVAWNFCNFRRQRVALIALTVAVIKPIRA